VRELVGQGKPFYSALDKAAGLLRRKVGTGSEFLKELMSIPGVKQAEIAERGLGELLNAPKMTHEQFMAALGEKPAPAIGEKVLGEKPALPSKEILRRNANDLIRVRAREYASEGADSSEEYRRLAAEEMQRLRTNHMDQALRLAEERATENPSSTYHEGYTLPGGENYREMLIKAPLPKTIKDAKEWFPGVPAHFNHEPGILASMRLKDRMVDQPAEIRHVAFNNNSGHPTPDFATPEELDAYIKTLPANIQSSLVKKQAQIAKPPLKLLHLEELQSDWHQQGRDRGYKDPQAEQKIAQMGELKRTYDELNKRRYAIHEQASKDIDLETFDKLMDEANGIAPKLLALNSQMHDLEHFKRTQQDAIPDAPFKKNWEEMALKRLIHHAAENGYHGVVVTPGAEQADRYSLAKHVDELHYNPQTHRLIAKKKGVRLLDEQSVPPEKLEAHIGKEAASKIMSQEPNVNGLRSLEGEELHIGGGGMKKFYDEKVPNILNSIGKKYGVKTELGGHTIQGRGKERTEEEFRQALMDAGHRTNPLTLAQQRELDYEPKPTPLHYFPITEEMRKDVKKNGIPLYKSGGLVPTQ